MGRKITLYLTGRTSSFVAQRQAKTQENWSGTINESIEALDHIMKENTPLLNVNEWKLLAERFVNLANSPIKPPLALASEMLRSANVISIEDVTDHKLKNLIYKLADLKQVEQIAILDRVRTYLARTKA